MVKIKTFIDRFFWIVSILILCIAYLFYLHSNIRDQRVLGLIIFSYILFIFIFQIFIQYLLIVKEKIFLLKDKIFVSFIFKNRFLLLGILAAALLIISFYSICYILGLPTNDLIKKIISKKEYIFKSLLLLFLGVLLGIQSISYVNHFLFTKKYYIPRNYSLDGSIRKLNNQKIRGEKLVPAIRYSRYNYMFIFAIIVAISFFFINKSLFLLMIMTPSFCCSSFMIAGARVHKNRKIEQGWLTFKGIAERDWNNFISHYMSHKKGAMNEINWALLRLDTRKARRRLKKYASTISMKDKYVTMARIAYIREKYHEVEKIFSQAEESGISSDRLHYLYACALYSMGKYEDGINLLKRRINSNAKSERNAHLFLKLALNYLALNRRDEALETIGTACKLDPQCPVSKSYKALILGIISKNLMDFGPTQKERIKYEDAKSTLTQALDLINDAMQQIKILSELKPYKYMSRCLNISFINIRGYINYKLGNMREATQDLFYCIDLDKSGPWPFFHLGLISKRFGNDRGAHYYFSVVMSMQNNATFIYKAAHKRQQDLEKKIETRVNTKISHAISTG